MKKKVALVSERVTERMTNKFKFTEELRSKKEKQGQKDIYIFENVLRGKKQNNTPKFLQNLFDQK